MRSPETIIISQKLFPIVKNWSVSLMQSGELTLWSRAITVCCVFLSHEVVRLTSSIIKIKDLAYDCVSYGREECQVRKCNILCLGSPNTLFLEMTPFYKEWRNLTNALWLNSQHFGLTFSWNWNHFLGDTNLKPRLATIRSTFDNLYTCIFSFEWSSYITLAIHYPWIPMHVFMCLF